MKKILIFILSITCLISCTMFAACNFNDVMSGALDKATGLFNPNKTGETESNIVLMNGFNKYEDLSLYDLNPNYFKGNWEINTNKDYIVEGNGSWRIYLQNTGANQPEFKTITSQMKADITDVSEFGLWVYSEAEYEFDILITAFAGDDVACMPKATVKPGANELSFPVNRAQLISKGKLITNYSISFSGIKSETTLYVDNFYVKTTTDPVVIPMAVQEVIDGIKTLETTPTRDAVEAVKAKYDALSLDDKLCIGNAYLLTAKMNNFYKDDLNAAKVEDTKTLLYFDKPFGEYQVTGTTAGIGAYSYSTERNYGKEEGSLKVEFSLSSTNWVTLSTTAYEDIVEENIEFAVYNDSDQYKAMCIAWNGPATSEYDLPFYVLNPHEWTSFLIKTTDLTESSVGDDGTIQICGLASMDKEDPAYASARSPEGTMYFSSFVKRDDRLEVQNARTGEDSNTVFFFDRELGLKQIDPLNAGMDITVSEDVKINGEDCLQIYFDDVAKTDGTTPTKARLQLYPYSNELTEGKYVAFYAYAKLEGADYARIRLGDYYGTYIYNNKTSLVLMPAEKVAEISYLKVEAEVDAETLGGSGWSANEFANTDGYVYLSKAKLYTADEVKDLTGVEDTYEYNIGSTTFVGNVYEKVKGTYNYNSSVYASNWDVKPYVVGDVLRVYARAEWSDWSQDKTRNTALGFELKEAVASAGKKVYITASGFGEDPCMQVMTGRETGHQGTPHGTIVERHADGFVTWCFDISTYDFDFKYFALYTGHKLLAPDFELVTIRDIRIEAPSA